MTSIASVILCILTFLPLFAEATPDRSLFEPGQNCVAYRVKKTSLVFFTGSPIIGKNCDISAQLLPAVGGGMQVEVSVPVASFDSGDKARDDDVKKILNEAEQSNILFHSEVMSEKEWRALLQKDILTLRGELLIGGKPYKVDLPLEFKKASRGLEADGLVKLSFGQLGMEPPKVGGGVIAKADSELELHFHLQTEKILGAEVLLAPEKGIL
jgi:hypothetical protein